MRNAGSIHYALFWNESNGLQCTYFVNNGLQSASVNRRVLNIIHKMVQIPQQSVVIGSKQGGTLKPVNPKHEDWASIQLLTLSVWTFLFSLDVKLFYNEKKNGNALNAWRNFRIDLTWQMGKKQAENEKQTFFEGLHWVVFQFYTQSYFIRQNNTIWCCIISTEKDIAGRLR